MVRKIIYTVLVWLMLIGVGFPATHYVSQSGTGDGSALETPDSIADFNAGVFGQLDDDTVYILDAITTPIVIPDAGTNGHIATYRGDYAGHECTITATSNNQLTVSSKNYVLIQGFTFSGGGTGYSTGRQLYILNSNYVEATGNTFSGGGVSSDQASLVLSGSNYNYIHANTFNKMWEATGEANESDTISLNNSDYNRIISNTITDGGGHFLINLTGGSDYNVIRSNNGYLTTACDDDGAPDNSCSDGYLSLIGDWNQTNTYNVFEDNYFKQTSTSARGVPIEIIINNSYNIFRRNIFDTPRGFIISFNSFSFNTQQYNFYYNNTFYLTGNFHSSDSGLVYLDTDDYNNGNIQYNQFINNIWHTYAYNGFAYGSSAAVVHDNQFRGNILYGISGNEVWRHDSPMTLSTAESSYPAEFSNNLLPTSTEPTFTNAAGGDFTADDGDAPQVDAGDWLTTITTATGSGTQFTVANPYFFYDGLGIQGESGDSIKTENGQTATITSINYNTGAITVAPPGISWEKDEGISRLYNGNKPDIGAEEYGGTPPAPAENFSPANGASGVDVDTHLTFDYQSGETFDVYIDKTDCSTLECDDNADGDCDPGTLDNSATYYWKVHANTANQDFPSSGCFTFTTVGTPADVLSVVRNAAGLTVIRNSAGLTVVRP